MSRDLLAPALILVSSYILCLPFSFLKTPFQKNMFSVLASGIQYLAFFEWDGYLQLLVLSVVCYYATLATRTNKRGPLLLFVMAMGTLSVKSVNGFVYFVYISQLYSQVFSSQKVSRVDHTVPMMIVVQKVTNFAWACYDGSRPARELSPHQQKTQIKSPPTLLSFLGFIFFFPGFLVGPSFDFKAYQQYINNDPPFQNIYQIPGRYWSTFITTSLVGTFNYEYALTKGYLEMPFWKSGSIQRAQFYVAWKLSEGACILSGFGYNGNDENGKPRWDACINVKVWNIEFAENIREFLGNWNIKTAQWLRNSVYLRIAPEPLADQTPEERAKARGNSGVATLLTFVCSAFWHGFYPGYYGTFITLSLINSCGRIARRTFRPLFHHPSKLSFILPIYHVIGFLSTQFAVNYAATSFQVLTIQNTMVIWGANYYIVHACIFGMLVLDKVGVGRVVKAFGRLVGAGYEERRGVGSSGGRKGEEVVLDEKAGGSGKKLKNGEKVDKKTK
ncbi:lysophospholipid acyltransferase [Blyttiomyces sp. JEL0837]|nr:lysophospholipid acyltransferase [Blyttiomyces sp. JEL0837]